MKIEFNCYELPNGAELYEGDYFQPKGEAFIYKITKDSKYIGYQVKDWNVKNSFFRTAGAGQLVK